MTQFINLNDFDEYLKNQGYRFIKDMNSSRIVNLVENQNGIKTVLKRDKGHPEAKQTLVEKEILERLNGLDRLPRKILFRNNLEGKIPKKSQALAPGLKGYFLEQQFIEGSNWINQQLSTSEEQKLINLVRAFHKEGYSRMDLFKSNFILALNEELYYIDAGNCIQKGNEDFEIWKEYDLRDLDKILKKSMYY